MYYSAIANLYIHMDENLLQLLTFKEKPKNIEDEDDNKGVLIKANEQLFEEISKEFGIDPSTYGVTVMEETISLPLADFCS